MPGADPSRSSPAGRAGGARARRTPVLAGFFLSGPPREAAQWTGRHEEQHGEDGGPERLGELVVGDADPGVSELYRAVEREHQSQGPPRPYGPQQLLAAGPKAQLELARTIGVTPSVVVDMLDELEELAALRRVRDTVDRRRQLIELTPEGHGLRRTAVRLAGETDEELLGVLTTEETALLRRALGRMAAASGIPARGR